MTLLKDLWLLLVRGYLALRIMWLDYRMARLVEEYARELHKHREENQ